MQLDPAQTDPGQVYSQMIRAITPRPIAWISTVSPSGVVNVAPFSYFNGVCSQPAALMFSAVNKPDGAPKDTIRNIEANGQFVVNVVCEEAATAMFATSEPYDYEVSEVDLCGLTSRPSHKVAPPGIEQSPVQLECQVFETLSIGTGRYAATVVIGQILWMRADDDVLDERGRIDPARLKSIGRLGGRAYCRTQDRFDLPSD